MTRDTAERAREWSLETMRMINELTPDIKGKAFDPGWFLLRQRLEEFESRVTQAEARERLATWMVEHSFSTGHGDTFEDLLKELDWQVKELRQKVDAVQLEEARSIKLNYEEMNGAPFEKWLDKRIAALAQALQPEEREG